MGYDWKELQRLIGWSDEDMARLKAEYEKVKKEEGYNGRPRVRRIPER